jgi:phage shock protein PspC (stress-responsive transcriptional regulator)
MDKKLRRSNDQFVGGVCSGIAIFFGIDTTIIRVLYAIITLFTGGMGVVLYIVLWAIIPEEPKLP